MSSNGKNGNGHGDQLSALGAPHWFVISERASEQRHAGLCERVAALEAVVGTGATARGARAGRKWGAILGALVATFTSTALSQCHYPESPPGSQSR